MAKNDPIGIRLEKSERIALERAAKKDDRTLSAMARKMITDALKKEGWMK